jgi:pimeloyl-ACP methyl ester carboxylesterase
VAVFLLVHGAWHGAWCWERLVPVLEARGHRAVAIDLPGHGDNGARPFRVTLGSYSRCIRAAAEGLGSAPIAVGHSMGGMGITQAASDAPQLFSALVYLCAFAPLHGESLFSLGRRDAGSLVPAAAAYGLTSVGLRPEGAKAAFYGDLSDAEADRAVARLCREPLRPLAQRHSRRHEIDLPRAYIECTRDRAISLELQRAMAARHAFERVVSMDTSHSPFLSAPEALAGHLEDLAALARPRR